MGNWAMDCAYRWISRWLGLTPSPRRRRDSSWSARPDGPHLHPSAHVVYLFVFELAGRRHLDGLGVADHSQQAARLGIPLDDDGPALPAMREPLRPTLIGFIGCATNWSSRLSATKR